MHLHRPNGLLVAIQADLDNGANGDLVALGRIFVESQFLIATICPKLDAFYRRPARK